MQVAKWGNSLAIRIPAAVADILDLKEGDEINVIANGVDTLAIERKPGRPEMWARLDKFVGRLPPDWKFDREEANAR